MSFDKKDYQEFLQTECVSPPKGLDENILAVVSVDLNPSAWKVFSKLTLIHFLSALLTLSVCPQFGFRVSGSGHGLMGAFMDFGPYGCMIACGSFFLGTSLFIAVSTLQIEEIKTLRKYRWVQIASLIMLSFGAFLMVGAEEVVLSLAFAWTAGTFLGALSVLEIGWFVRRKVLT